MIWSGSATTVFDDGSVLSSLSSPWFNLLGHRKAKCGRKSFVSSHSEPWKVVVFCGTALFCFFCRKIFALHICKNCEQVHSLVSLLLSDEFDFGFGSIASIWSYEVSNYILSFFPTIFISGTLSPFSGGDGDRS
ncbi:hypothetical protein QL285_026610 [Trifolium repens]|nr:hypothetical protein QL285_026610 [Trifolium repens]